MGAEHIFQIIFTEIIGGNKADLGLELNFFMKKQQHRSYLAIYCTVWNEETNGWA